MQSENLGATDIELTTEEVTAIEEKLVSLNTSALYGTTGGPGKQKERIAGKYKKENGGQKHGKESDYLLLT